MNLIEINPEIRFGQPIITGTRITVEDVLSWLSNGLSKFEIKSNYIELNDDQIDACLAYAASKELKSQISN